MSEAWVRLEVTDGVGLVIMDRKPVNALTPGAPPAGRVSAPGQVVQCLRQRDADGAVRAHDALITALRSVPDAGGRETE